MCCYGGLKVTKYPLETPSSFNVCLFCPREVNSVAHELASVAKISAASIWMDEAPTFISPSIVNDATLITNEQEEVLL